MVCLIGSSSRNQGRYVWTSKVSPRKFEFEMVQRLYWGVVHENLTIGSVALYGAVNVNPNERNISFFPSFHILYLVSLSLSLSLLSLLSLSLSLSLSLIRINWYINQSISLSIYLPSTWSISELLWWDLEKIPSFSSLKRLLLAAISLHFSVIGLLQCEPLMNRICKRD